MRKHYLSEQIRGLSVAARTDQEGDLLNQVARELDSMWECLSDETAPRKGQASLQIDQVEPELTLAWDDVFAKLETRDTDILCKYVPIREVSPIEFAQPIFSMGLKRLPFCGTHVTKRIRTAFESLGVCAS